MIVLAGKEYETLYQWEAIEGIQTDLNEDSLDDLYKAIQKVHNSPEIIKRKDITNLMKIAKVVVYHGIRNYCLFHNIACDFQSIAHVGAKMDDMKAAMREVVLFQGAMFQLFYPDPDEDLGNATGEAQPN